MKKLTACILAVLLVLSILPAAVIAEGETDGGWTASYFPGTLTAGTDPDGTAYQTYSSGAVLPNGYFSPGASVLDTVRALAGDTVKSFFFTFSARVRYAQDAAETPIAIRPVLRVRNGTKVETADWNTQYKAWMSACGEPVILAESSGNIMYRDFPISYLNKAWTDFSLKVDLSKNTVAEDFMSDLYFCFDSIAPYESVAGLDVTPLSVSVEQKKETTYPVVSLNDEIGPDVECVNVVPAISSDFEQAGSVSATGWTNSVGTVTKRIDVAGDGNRYFTFVKPEGDQYSYYSAAIDLAKLISRRGLYTITFDYKLGGSGTENVAFGTAVRTNRQFSFAPQSGSQYYRSMTTAHDVPLNEWRRYSVELPVQEVDLTGTRQWNFCFHNMDGAITEVSVDNFRVERTDIVPRQTVYTWVANEFSFKSTKTYADPYKDVDMDFILTNGTETYTVPAFWNGENIWCVRFVCPKAGTWTYRTVCTDTADTGLHGKTGTVECHEYTGAIDIYRHGFVKTVPGTRNFVYGDGTPFLYLGDTHWSLGSEPQLMVETEVRQRVGQGFTVWQSEPLGVSFKLADGLTQEDIGGLEIYDRKFRTIAEYGLVHANASFFFPSEMDGFIKANGGYSTKLAGYDGKTALYEISDQAKAALERLSRYWVARYGAYPVMWTLAQEIDDDYFRSATSHPEWGIANNPYRWVATYMNQYDPYKSPLSGHMETATPISGSSLRDLPAHTWYAKQWKQSYNVQVNATQLVDAWENGQGKPVVLYEGNYCYLYGKEFGARLQGWLAYLSGMYGYGWGGQDTWCYLSSYSEDYPSKDGVDTVTPEQKKEKTWQDSMEFDSTYQMGYLRDFMQNTVRDWTKLVPRFEDTAYLKKESDKVFALCASSEEETVAYFYQFSDPRLAEFPSVNVLNAKLTGTLGSLKPDTDYLYQWLDPNTGTVERQGYFRSSSSGTWTIGQKSVGDMVLYVRVHEKELKVTSDRTALRLGESAESLNVRANLVKEDGTVQANVPVTLSGLDTSLAGAQTVTVSASDAGATVTASLPVQVVKLGDMNLDGAVDAQDLTLLARLIAKIETSDDPAVLLAADTDKNGGVTADDLTLLARVVARIIGELS